VADRQFDRRRGYRSLRDFVDVLDLQATSNEFGDYGIVAPTKEPETGGTAVCSSNISTVFVCLHAGDLIECRVPLGPLRISGDEFYSILAD
jgi:hypothetical protein